MSYKQEIVEVQPDEEAPDPDHNEGFYCHLELIKKKGRRKKADPYQYKKTYIPWTDINSTELVHLSTYGLAPGSREEMSRWNVVCRGLRRQELIGIIRGEVDAKEMRANPAHVARDRLSHLIYNYWKYIHTQIKCNTLCWECPDAKAFECMLENKDILRAEDA